MSKSCCQTKLPSQVQHVIEKVWYFVLSYSSCCKCIVVGSRGEHESAGVYVFVNIYYSKTGTIHN